MVLPLILGAASVVGGIASASAAKKGAAAQERAASEANETQRYIYDNNVALTEPQREAGNLALNALLFQGGLGDAPVFGGSAPYEIREINDTQTERQPIYASSDRLMNPIQGYEDVTTAGATRFAVGDQTFDTRDGAQEYLDGLPRQGGTTYSGIPFPDRPDTSLAAFEASPGYNFRIKEGMDGISKAAAARGMNFSGNMLRSVEQFRQGLASDEFGAFYNRANNDYRRDYGAAMDQQNLLRGIAGMGQTATQMQVGAGDRFATNTANNLLTGANAQARGYMGQANAFNGTINSLATGYGLYNSGYFDPARGAA